MMGPWCLKRLQEIRHALVKSNCNILALMQFNALYQSRLQEVKKKR